MHSWNFDKLLFFSFFRDNLLLYLLYIFIIFIYIYLFILGGTACGILVPGPGIEPGPSAVKALSPNHWTTREFPIFLITKLTCAISKELHLKSGTQSFPNVISTKVTCSCPESKGESSLFHVRNTTREPFLVDWGLRIWEGDWIKEV